MKDRIQEDRDRAEAALAKAEAAAADHLAKLFDPESAEGERPWTEVRLRDKAAIALAGWQAARSRSTIAAKAAPKTLGVIVMPAPLASKEDWERKARELERSGRQVIDTTIGPAIPIGKDNEHEPEESAARNEAGNPGPTKD